MSRRRALAWIFFSGLLAGCAPKQPQAPPDPKSTEVVEFHAALRDGDVDIISRLLSAKPYLVNARNEQGQSPLQVAEQSGNQELADLIRKRGGKP